MTVEQCSKRWKNIRDHFVREVRKKKKKKSVMLALCTSPAGHCLTCFSSSLTQSDTDRKFLIGVCLNELFYVLDFLEPTQTLRDKSPCRMRRRKIVNLNWTTGIQSRSIFQYTNTSNFVIVWQMLE